MTWRVARSLLVLRDQVNLAHPGRSTRSDGTIGDAAHQAGASDHNPDAAGVVRALDLTHDPDHGVDIGQLAESLRSSRDQRIKYIIANGRICSATVAPWQWRTYTGADQHREHLHLSVVADGRADDARYWRIAAPVREELSMADIERLMTTLTAIDNRVRAALLQGASPVDDVPGEGAGHPVWLVEQIREIRTTLAAIDNRVRSALLQGASPVDDVPGEGAGHPVWLVEQIREIRTELADLAQKIDKSV